MEKPSVRSREHPSSPETRRIAWLLILGAGLMLLVKYFSNVVAALGMILRVFSPFFLGAAIAFVLNVPMKGMEKALFGNKWAKKKPFLQKIRRPVAIILTFLLVLVFLTLYVRVLVPQLRETGAVIAASAQAFFPKVEAWIDTAFASDPDVIAFFDSLDWGTIRGQVSGFLHRGLGKVLSSGVGVVVSLVSGISTFIIGLVFSVYILGQKERLANQARRLITAALPRVWADRVCSVAALTHRTFSSFVRGQCLEAMILGAMFAVTMTVLQMPYALLIGVLIAITALIPIFGAFVGCILSALMILMVDPMQALFFVILFLVLQQVEGNFIYPHVVGSSVGLPSIWVLVAVTIGGSLMGVIGMLIFIPLTSVAYTLLKNWTNSRNERSRVSKNSTPPQPEA